MATTRNMFWSVPDIINLGMFITNTAQIQDSIWIFRAGPSSEDDNVETAFTLDLIATITLSQIHRA